MDVFLKTVILQYVYNYPICFSVCQTAEDKAVKQGSSISVKWGMDCSWSVYTFGPEGPAGLSGFCSVPDSLRLYIGVV